MGSKKVSKKKAKTQPPQCSEDKSAAALLDQLKTASTLSTIEAALAEAKASGFSNKHESYKHAKRRLFALQSGEALEDLLAKEESKKRKRSFSEDITELELRVVKSKFEEQDVTVGKKTVELTAKEGKKKRKKEKLAALAEEAAEQTEESKQIPKESSDLNNRQPSEFQVRIAGFPYSENEESLKKYFCSFGTISQLELIKDKAERSRAIAFITFESEEGYSAALESNGQEYKGRYLKISKPIARTQKGSKLTTKNECLSDAEFKIIIAGLPYTTEPDRVQRKFAKCGEMESFYMPVNRAGSKRGQSKGFAFATYKTQQALDMALSHNGDTWLGSTLVVKRKHDGPSSNQDPAVTPNVTPKEFEVFAGGLYSIARKVIKSHFAECGEIEKFEMPLTREGESKGIAFIAYKTKEGMENALALHDTQLGKRWLTVERRVHKTI